MAIFAFEPVKSVKVSVTTFKNVLYLAMVAWGRLSVCPTPPPPPPPLPTQNTQRARPRLPWLHYRNLLKVMSNWSKANICRVRYLILFLALYQKSFCLIMLIGWMKWVVLLENGYIPCWPWVWIWMDTLKWQSTVNFQFIKTSLPYWTILSSIFNYTMFSFIYVYIQGIFIISVYPLIITCYL